MKDGVLWSPDTYDCIHDSTISGGIAPNSEVTRFYWCLQHLTLFLSNGETLQLGSGEGELTSLRSEADLEFLVQSAILAQASVMPSQGGGEYGLQFTLRPDVEVPPEFQHLFRWRNKVLRHCTVVFDEAIRTKARPRLFRATRWLERENEWIEALPYGA